MRSPPEATHTGPDRNCEHQEWSTTEWTKLLALTGRINDADTALRAGLVLKVLSEDDLLGAAIALAAAIAALPGLAVQVGTLFLHGHANDGFRESVEAVALLHRDEHCAAVAVHGADHGH